MRRAPKLHACLDRIGVTLHGPLKPNVGPADATASEELSADTHIGTRALAADILSSIARFDEARRVYNSILRDEPESRQALLGTANLLVKQQKYLTGREGGGTP